MIGMGHDRRLLPDHKFREAARQLECDDDRFKERVKKLVRQKPVEKPE